MTPKIFQKYYFSTEALASAYVNVNLSLEIISQRQDLKEPIIDIKYCSCNLNAIINSVMFIEASINELFSEINEWKDNRHEYAITLAKGLGENSIKRFQQILEIKKDLLNKDSILDKYNFTLAFFDKEKLDKSRDPYQSVKLLIDLRNFLIHYKLDTLELFQENRQKLERSCQDKLTLHPELASGISIENAFYYPFPRNYLSDESAKWAIKTARQFVEDFYNNLDANPPYQIDPNDLIYQFQ